MGYQELIDALIKEGEEKIKAIWQKANDESEKILFEKDKRILEIRERYEKLRQSIFEEKREKIMLESKKEERRIRLDAERKFMERIYNLSLSVIYLLREECKFFDFTKEIPEYKWEIVEVNKADQEIAKEQFPNSKVLIDDSISGGLRVKTKDERLCIDNTLEKRLERAWDHIVPELIKEVYDIAGIRK